MSTVKLWPHQVGAIDAVQAAWGRGMRRPAIVLPTGAGKSITIAGLVAREHEAGRVQRSLLVAHRIEIVTELAKSVRAVAPHLRAGIVQGTTDQTGADVVCAMVQTLGTKKRRDRVRNVGLVVIDEAHHAAAPTYRDLLGHYGCLDGTDGPYGRRSLAMGCTATMSRGDGLGLGEIWEDVVFRRSIAAMIRGGFLVEPRGKRVDVEDLALEKVKRRGGDYADGALGEALTASLAPKRIVEAWQEYASERATVLFAPTVAFAEVMRDAFRAAGVTAEMIHGNTPKEERATILGDLAGGRVQVVCNCMVLTEGFDAPVISCVIVARPTTHAGLYIQMVGRGLRRYPGKVDALVLDVAGASRRHGLSIQVDLIGTEDVSDDADDLSLLGALEEDAEAADEGDGGLEGFEYRDGLLRVEDVDLFHGSRFAWQQTEAGMWFLPVGNRYLCLLPDGSSGWDVAAVESWAGGRSWWVHQGALDVAMAMDCAEEDVSDSERAVVARDASFRVRAPNRVDAARTRRLFGVTPATVGEMRRLETVRHASDRLDAGYRRVLATHSLGD